MAVIIFTGSSLNAFSSEFGRNCGQLSLDIYNSYIAQGFTYAYANQEADEAYNLCAALGDSGRDDVELTTVIVSN